MIKTYFSIKWKEKFAWQVMQTCLVLDLADKLMPDWLLKTSVLWPFRNELVALLGSSIVSRVKAQPINPSGYSDEQLNLDATTNTPGLWAQQKNDVYRNKKFNLENLARTSGLSARKSDNRNSISDYLWK